VRREPISFADRRVEMRRQRPRTPGGCQDHLVREAPTSQGLGGSSCPRQVAEIVSTTSASKSPVWAHVREHQVRPVILGG
jgi:hypothetical protein